MIIDLPRFISAERPAWTELEKFLDRLDAELDHRLTIEEAHHFHFLYQKASADLARLATFASEPELRRYLETLVGRAYGEIHETRERGARWHPVGWFLREFPAAMTPHHELFRERVDRLGAHAVEADAELEHVIVVFGSRVDLGHAIHHFAQRDAAAVIAHADLVALDADQHLLAVAHDEFVDGVVDHLLEQDVAAVVVMGAVADAPDVHAGAQADVFEGTERLDLALVVGVFFFVSHGVESGNIGTNAPLANKEMRL